MVLLPPRSASVPHSVRRLGESSPERVAVLRALQLGDMLCAVPALRALRRALPHATITLIALPWAASFAERFAAYLDDFIEFPGFPGLPERPCDPRAVTSFLDAAQRREFDLAIQLHGSGSFINECVTLLGAKRTAGFYRDGDVVPDPERFMRWPNSGTETRRLLALTRFLGAPPESAALEFPITDRDRGELAAALVTAHAAAAPVIGPYVCVHPGARFPSRRWPPERFAQVADALADRGLDVCLTGTAGEAEITGAVASHMRTPPLDLTGRLTLGALAALIHGAALVVANDTGISHVAAAVGTPSVIVASGSDVRRWAPHDGARHRVLWHDMPCRPCMHATCPIGHPCARRVETAGVLRTALELLHTEPAYVA